MSKVHGKDFYVMWNSVDLSPFVNDVTWGRSLDTAEVSTMGDSSKEFLAGLKDAACDISGFFDGVAGGPDVTLGDAIGTTATLAVRANSGAIATTNPEYQVQAILVSYEITGNMGDAVGFSASFQPTGAVTRDTTP